MTMADRVIQAAERWLGYLEKKSNQALSELTANAGTQNYTIFAQQYADRWGEDYQGQPWCAVFVSCMLFEGCGKELVPPFAYCPYGVTGFQRRGQWFTSNPQRGDVIFFRDSQGIACHVGLVSSVGNGKVVTIEGNTSGELGMVANGGCVRRKSYALGYARILGYGRPAYEEVPETMTKEEIQAIAKAIAQTTAQTVAETTAQAAAQTAIQALRQELTQAYETSNPKYTAVEQVPSWWQEEVRGMLACGAIQGDGVHPISLRHDALQAAIIMYRALRQQQTAERGESKSESEPEPVSSDVPESTVSEPGATEIAP